MGNSTQIEVSPARARKRSAFRDRFRAYLRDENLSLTSQRERIVDAVLSIDDHFSADDLAAALEKRGSRVGTATIYRTLALMVSAQVIREHDFGGGYRTFERMIDRRLHDHLICEACGRIVEFVEPSVEDAQRQVVRRHRFVVRSRKLEIYGLCRKCSPGAVE